MLAFALFYLLNYLHPLDASSYTTRIWNWTEWTLTGSPLLQRPEVTLHWFYDFTRFNLGY